MKGTRKSKHWKTKDHTHDDETGLYQYSLVCEESNTHNRITVSGLPEEQEEPKYVEDPETNRVGICFAVGLLVFIIGAILMMAFL